MQEKLQQVKLMPHNPSWAGFFKKEADSLRQILGEQCVSVHHIGSTAIKDIYAKPIIDILPVVNDISKIDVLNNRFEALGYHCMGEYGIPGRRFYFKNTNGERSHQVHLFESGNTEIDRHLAFCQYMQAHPDVAHAYSQIKCDLAAQFSNDIVSYVNGKESFIRYIDYMTGNAKQDQLLAGDEVKLLPYDLNWNRIAKAEIASIESFVGLPSQAIQHLGSTAIEGMLAKPTIDIFIALESIDTALAWVKPLEQLGYVFWEENPNKQHLRFFKGMPPYGMARTHHLHIMEKGENFDKRVKFSELLKNSPDICEQYLQLKQMLAQKFPKDREAYTDEKGDFVKQVLEKMK